MELYHSFESPLVKEACQDLISHNAEYLINYIYSNTTRAPYTDRVVRVGLSLKTLLRSASSSESAIVSSEAIEPVIRDLSELIARASSSTERRMYVDELTFLQKCTVLDELVSLNTQA